VLVGVAGAAIVALIAVLVWRHRRHERERKEFETSPNLTYFGDEPEEGGHSASPDSQKESLHRSPTRVNAAANSENGKSGTLEMCGEWKVDWSWIG
jgi:hypothetical protein